MSKYLKSGWKMAGGIKESRAGMRRLASDAIEAHYPTAKTRVRIGMNTRLHGKKVATGAAIGGASYTAGSYKRKKKKGR